MLYALTRKNPFFQKALATLLIATITLPKQNILITSASSTPAIVISQIQISGETSKDEFLKIYNNSSDSIQLENFRLTKMTSSGNESALIAEFPAYILESKTELFIAHPTDYTGTEPADITYSSSQSIASNNTVTLYDVDNNILDQVGMGTAQNFENEATFNPEATKAIIRRFENGVYVDTDNNNTDFTLQEGAPTPEPEEEKELEEENNQVEETIPYNYQDILINEFVADPISGESEWIELYNNTKEDIDLAGWTVEDASKKQTDLEGSLASYDFYVIESPKGALNNNGDMITLKFQDTLIDQVAYGEFVSGDAQLNAPSHKDPNATARKYDGVSTQNNAEDFALTQTPTQGKPNLITVEEAVHEEDDALRQAQGDSEKNKKPSFLHLVISEIAPNPKGPDGKHEFIELHNQGPLPLQLKNVLITDDSPIEYIFSDYLMAPNEYLVLTRETTGIALNNQGKETVFLKDPNDKTIEKITYNKDVAENTSLSLIGSRRRWTSQVTPNAENVLNKTNALPTAYFYSPEKIFVGQTITFDASDSYDANNDIEKYSWRLTDISGNTISNMEGVLNPNVFFEAGNFSLELTVQDKLGNTNTTHKNIEIKEITPSKKQIDQRATPIEDKTEEEVTKNQETQTIDIQAAKLQEKNTEITIMGTVTTPMNILDNKSFYIQDGTAGIKVYMTDPDNAIHPGDQLKIEGKVSEAAGEKKINIKNKDAIQKLGTQTVEAKKLSISKLNDSHLGSYATIEGELIEKKRSRLVIDEGGVTLEVQIKNATQIDTTGLLEKQLLEISGIVRKEKDSYLLLPVQQSDIQFVTNEDVPVAHAADSEINSENSNTHASDSNERPLPIFPMIFIAASLLLAVLTWWRSNEQKKTKD